MTQDPKDPPKPQRFFPCHNEEGKPEWYDSRLPKEEWKRPADIAHQGDWVRRRGKPLTPRLRRLAYLLSYGKTNAEICAELGMSEAWLSLMKNNTDVKEQVLRYEEKIFREDLQKRMEEAGEDAMSTMEEILRDPDINVLKKESAAKWLLEKLTGKATQPVEQTGKTSLNVFLNLVKEARESGQIIDVSPTEQGELPELREGTAPEKKQELPTTKNTYASWIDEEL